MAFNLAEVAKQINPLGTAFAEPASPFEKGMVMTKEFEGFVPNVYKDTKGYDTIGYGFKLDNPLVKKLLGNRKVIDRPTADTIFNTLYENAVKDAKSFLGEEQFNTLPINKQEAIIDMSYNMGLNTLSGFKQFKKALLKGDMKTAGKEMVNSDWWRQVGRRSKALREIILTE